MRIFALPLLAVLVLGACSGGSKAPEPVFYLLRADSGAAAAAQTPPAVIGINRIILADYLGQAGIVVETAAGQVRPARQHLWAEPLDSSLRLFLRDAISARLGYPVSADTGRRLNWDYRLDIRIDQWHGSLGGDVQIDASWLVIDVASDSEIARQRFTRTGRLAADGYDALVRAQTDLLQELAAAVADSLGGIGE